MSNETQIHYCLSIILRAEKLINQLTDSGKKKEVKKAAGKLILMERKNIKTMKTKLILLGTTYESAMQQSRLTVQLSSRQSGKTAAYASKYTCVNTPSARGKIGTT
jgi:hypothetical protein